MAHADRFRKGIALKLIAVFLAGLITTVLVAWAAASSPAENRLDGYFVLVSGDRQLSVTRTSSRCRQNWIVYTAPPPKGLSPSPMTIECRPPWVTIPEPPYDTCGSTACGWPLVCLSSHLDSGSPARAAGRRTASRVPIDREVGALTWHHSNESDSLPILPIWPNLLIDSALYGLIFASVLFGVGVAGRSCRQRAGRCLQCGYDLKGQSSRGICPECGANKEGTARV
jgi:hypothetical protein